MRWRGAARRGARPTELRGPGVARGAVTLTDASGSLTQSEHTHTHTHERTFADCSCAGCVKLEKCYSPVSQNLLFVMYVSMCLRVVAVRLGQSEPADVHVSDSLLVKE